MEEKPDSNKVKAELISDPTVTRYFTKASFELNKVHGKWRLCGSKPEMAKVLEKKSVEVVEDSMAQHAQLNEEVKSESPFATIGEKKKRGPKPKTTQA
jgi:hypothetical protein